MSRASGFVTAAMLITMPVTSTTVTRADPIFRQMHPMPSNRQLTTEEIKGPMSPAIGATAAPVTIIAFSDYYCPYCRTLSATLARLLEKYPQQVRIVFRHFATSSETQQLSQAALCASEQNRFLEYHNRIFATRGVAPEHVNELAAEIGLDGGAFSDCMNTRRYQQRVEEDIREGNRLGIEVTPTLFINGKRTAGAATLEALSAQVEHALR